MFLGKVSEKKISIYIILHEFVHLVAPCQLE